MKTLLITLASLLTLVACANASASETDASNPLHCGAQLQAYSAIAGQQGDRVKEKGFALRAQWYGELARSRGLSLTEKAKLELADKILAAPDGGAALATECIKQQDADPDFHRLTRRG